MLNYNNMLRKICLKCLSFKMIIILMVHIKWDAQY